MQSDGRFADGRPEFVQLLDRLLSNQEGGIWLVAPAIHLTSAELVRRSGLPTDVLAWSHSCQVSEHACGRCRGCCKRREVLAELPAAGWVRAGG